MQEKTLTTAIFTINLVAASLASMALYEDERAHSGMIVYNFCMSQGKLWKYGSSMPTSRILENISVLSSLLGKVFLYVKMWTKISLLGRRQLPAESTARCKAWLPDGYSQIFRSYVFVPLGFWTMALLRYTAKFDPFLFLDCAPTPSTLAH